MCASKKARGHEQTGVRHAVELQGPIKLSTVIVAPTSTRAELAVCRPDFDMDGTTTKVLVNQMAAADGALRLGDVVRRLSAHEMTEVDLTCDSCSGRSEPESRSQ